MELTGMDERFDMVSDLSELERRISSSGELIHRAPSSTP
jgi:hypothetical protein